MEFLIIAHDGTDEGALDRRMNARSEHLEKARKMKEQGHLIEGGAILDEEGKMIGSTLYMQFDSREDVQKYIDEDPYVKGKVWEKIEVKPIRLVKF
ncbi:MAG: YciI family protein [Cyclobacteriaceae bacterium]